MPKEMCYAVTEYLTLSELTELAQVNREWRGLIQHTAERGKTAALGMLWRSFNHTRDLTHSRQFNKALMLHTLCKNLPQRIHENLYGHYFTQILLTAFFHLPVIRDQRPLNEVHNHSMRHVFFPHVFNITFPDTCLEGVLETGKADVNMRFLEKQITYASNRIHAKYPKLRNFGPLVSVSFRYIGPHEGSQMQIKFNRFTILHLLGFMRVAPDMSQLYSEEQSPFCDLCDTNMHSAMNATRSFVGIEYFIDMKSDPKRYRYEMVCAYATFNGVYDYCKNRYRFEVYCMNVNHMNMNFFDENERDVMECFKKLLLNMDSHVHQCYMNDLLRGRLVQEALADEFE